MSATASKLRKLPLAIHRTVQSFRTVRNALPNDVSVGLVPTMGALHEGHISLVKGAQKHNDIVVTSIFVNPTQFDKAEDLERYPKQLERDIELLSDLGVDYVFAPDVTMMYGANHMTFVDVEDFDDIPEGVSRPGHFRGVATIVTKLFNVVRPTNAYFGQKDAAQCILIRRIIQDLNMDIKLNIMDTVREPDGLAMSSRNSLLTPDQRKAAPIIYKSLCAAREVYHSAHYDTKQFSLPAIVLSNMLKELLSQEPLVSEVHYVSVDSKETMKPVKEVGIEGAVVSIACKIGSVRLIDNIIL